LGGEESSFRAKSSSFALLSRGGATHRARKKPHKQKRRNAFHETIALDARLSLRDMHRIRARFRGIFFSSVIARGERERENHHRRPNFAQKNKRKKHRNPRSLRAMRTRDFKINDASSFEKRTVVRDFIATALPTKAVCWTLVAANIFFSLSFFCAKIVRSFLVFLYLFFLPFFSFRGGGLANEKPGQGKVSEKSILFSLFSRLSRLFKFNSSTWKKKANVSNTFPREHHNKEFKEGDDTTKREIYNRERKRENI
jgi:hypothetical protein